MSALSYFNEPAPLAWDVAAAIFGSTGEGGLYDPSALDTLFQDANGTTPAVPGSPVGLVLDKSGNGINLSQPTTSARPILARMPLTGRRNLLTWTEDFTNAAWLKSGATIVGHKLVEGSSNAVHQIRGYALKGAGTYTAFFDASANERTRCELWIGNDSPAVGAGARFDLINGAVLSSRSVGGGASFVDAHTVDLGGGVYRCFVTAVMPTINVFAHLFVMVDGAPSKAIAYQGDGVSGINVYRGQLTLGTEVYPYQRVTNAYDVTEAGVPDTYSLVYDLADDALTTTLPQAISGDILIAGTKGSIIEPVSYAAGSTFTLGPTTYTGGTPGILRAIGDVVGVVLIDRTLTQTERENLLRHYKGRGAKGLLVPGPELIADPNFNDPSKWVIVGEGWSIAGGKATNSTGSSSNTLTPSPNPDSGPVGKVYLITLDIEAASAWMAVHSSRMGEGSGFTGTGPVSQIRVKTQAGTGSFNAQTPTGHSGTLVGFSVRELRPQEDWT